MPSVISPDDFEYIRINLGRPPRNILTVAYRQKQNMPAVITTSPLIDGKTPFPTFYYLIDRSIIKQVSKLEANGLMVELNQRLQDDADFANHYLKAHKAYIADREKIAFVPQIRDFSAGGMPKRVKCLHALVAHSLAVGPGINPVGDLVVSLIDL